MRTNIDIDDKLMKQAMKVMGVKTKKAAVEQALRQSLTINAQQAIEKLRGRIVWRGDDDDWFAPDEEILAKRRAEAREAVSSKRKIA